MLDIKRIREDFEGMKAGVERRGKGDFGFDRIRELDVKRRELLAEVEALKKRFPCTYIVGKTDFMAMAGHISKNFNMVAKSFMLHPVIQLKDGRMEAGRLMFGSMSRAWRRYIDYVIKGHEHEIDSYVPSA